MPLHLDYRPRSIDEVIGNEGVKDSLRIIFKRDDKPQALLFIGPSGCGKTTLARIVKDNIKCHPLDFHEVDASKDRGIAQMKSLVARIPLAPLAGPCKFYLLDECHQITGDAANALLKTLEEPPRHVFFALCTTNPEKLLPTIRTRCMMFEVKPLNRNEMTQLIAWVLENEKAEISPKVKRKLIAVADGCPRQALVLLDKVIFVPEEDVAIDMLEQSTIEEASITDLCRIISGPLAAQQKWESARRLLPKIGEDPEAIRRGIIGYYNSIMLKDKNTENVKFAARIITEFAEPTYSLGKPAITLFTYMACQL
jgi:DNA polymerase-3 subunit gamma/tau